MGRRRKETGTKEGEERKGREEGKRGREKGREEGKRGREKGWPTLARVVQTVKSW